MTTGDQLGTRMPCAHRQGTSDHGKWWADFWTGFSEGQREAIRAYLKGVRSMLGAFHRSCKATAPGRGRSDLVLFHRIATRRLGAAGRQTYFRKLNARL